LTATGAIIGTLGYMSPEQVQALETGPASDIFSLGSVLAYAASGSDPFRVAPGAPSASVMFRIVHGEPDLGAVPPDVRRLVEACLAKDPRQRPDLRQVAAHSTATAEGLGLSPAAFWPHNVAGVIQAQQTALSAQIEALQLTPGTHVEGPWGASGMPSGPAASASTWPSAGSGNSARSPVTDPAVARGIGPVTGGGPGGLGTGIGPGGLAVPVPPGAGRGTSRRGVLIGAGVGGIAVIGGAVGWALSSRSATNATPSLGTGSTSLPTGQGQSLQQYYGAGARRTAAWKFPTGNAIQANPGAGGGMVFVASTDKNVYAVKAATGRKAWSFEAGSVTAAPEVVGDVVCLSTSTGHFYALRIADGTRAWDLDTSLPTTYKRTWAVDGGNVIFGSTTTSPQAYDAATGTKGVRFTTQEPYVMALSAAGGVLYAIDAFGMLYAFHTGNGAEIWHKQLLTSDDLPGTGLTIDSGGIYVGTMSGALYKVDTANGNILWTYHPGSGMESDVVVAHGVVYLRDNNGTVHAISAANKKQLWAKTATAAGVYGPAVAGGRLYYTTALAVQALDAKSGDPVWAFTAPGNSEFLSTPAVANGLVFIGCYDDGLYAIQA
jgi:outer membrane protein assembly factor BamB